MLGEFRKRVARNIRKTFSGRKAISSRARQGIQALRALAQELFQQCSASPVSELGVATALNQSSLELCLLISSHALALSLDRTSRSV